MDLNKAQKGAEHVKSGGGSKKSFTPVIYWKENNEAKFLSFITPVSEFVTTSVHIYRTSEGWRTFICRKDPVFLDESMGHCPLCDELDDSPSRKHLAIAAELEPVVKSEGGRRQITDLNLKFIEIERDGETKSYPRIGLVMQAATNFFNYLTAYDTQRDDITNVSFEIVRQGKDTKTTYSFFDYQMRPDFSAYEEHIPDLLGYIEEKGSLSYYEEELDLDGASGELPEEAPADVAEAEEAADQFAALKARLEQRTRAKA